MLRDDNLRSSRFATECGRYYCAPAEHFEAESPLKDMPSMSLSKGKQDATHGMLIQQVRPMNIRGIYGTDWVEKIRTSHNMKAIEQRLLVPLTKIEAVATLPRYASYTSLRRNVLS
jgi:hypothetical protein